MAAGTSPRGQSTTTNLSLDEPSQSIHARFEKVVSVYGDRLAATNGDQRLTYLELNRRANRVARAILEARGAWPEPVAVVMERGLEMVAASFGVLKAGKCYLPIDAELPAERVRTLLDEARAELVVADATGAELVGRVDSPTGQVLRVDQLGDGGAEANPGIARHPDTPAWILYTSGSTGKPKGVVADHRVAIEWAMALAHVAGTVPEDRFASVASFSVAAGMHEVVSALLLGASLHVFDLKKKGAAEFAAWLRSTGITQLHGVPTMYRQLLAAMPDAQELPALRVIRLGGEAVHRADVEAFQRRFHPDALMFNSLAGTEIGLVTVFRIDKDTRLDDNNVPLGYPVKDAEVAVLDECGGPAAAGAVGEILIRSRYLSRGYWRRPELTAAAFRLGELGDPRRSYHTGDLGWIDSDGCLHHAGRKDFQVKIRGSRVDITEVESVFREAPGVREVAVMPRQDEGGGLRLVAYWVAEPGTNASLARIREVLSRRLADWMIPTVFVKLETMPLTASGKLDRQELPDPSEYGAQADTLYVPPRTNAEREMVELFSKTLGAERVGVDDSFFDLGGDSLLATRLLAGIERVFARKVGVGTLLEVSTPGGLAAVVTQEDAEPPEVVEIQPRGSRSPLFWVEGLPIHRYLAKRLGPDQPFLGLPLPDGMVQDGCTEKLAGRLVKAIERRQPTGPYYLGGWCAYGTIAYEVAQQLRNKGREVALLVLIDSFRPDSLEPPLPFRSKKTLHRRWARFWFQTVNFWYLPWREKRNQIIWRARRRLLRLRTRAESSSGMRLRFKKTPVAHDPDPSSRARRATRDYRPRPYGGRVVLFRAEIGLSGRVSDPDLGWRELAQGGLETHDVPGGHSTMFLEPGVEMLGEKLRRSLEEERVAQEKIPR